jgi:phosphomannomutase
MIQFLRALRKNVAIGFVGGSDFVKISEQLSVGDINGTAIVSLAAITILTCECSP